MHKSMKRHISKLIVVVLILTATVIPAHAASFRCDSCGISMTYLGQSFERTVYSRTCPNAPTLQHNHELAHWFNDYVCGNCGRTASEYLYTKQYCPYGNMSKTYIMSGVVRK